MKKVILISTGGTIAGVKNQGTTVTPSLSGMDLFRAIPSVKSVADVSVVEFSNVPSQYFDFKMMLNLSKTIENTIARENPDGMVITMGTNAMGGNLLFS